MRTHWQPQPPPRPLRVLRLPLKHRTTWRTCWTSTLTELHRLQHRRSPIPACPVSKALPAHQSVFSPRVSTPLHPATTWTTSLGFSGTTLLLRLLLLLLHPPAQLLQRLAPVVQVQTFSTGLVAWISVAATLLLRHLLHRQLQGDRRRPTRISCHFSKPKIKQSCVSVSRSVGSLDPKDGKRNMDT